MQKMVVRLNAEIWRKEAMITNQPTSRSYICNHFLFLLSKWVAFVFVSTLSSLNLLPKNCDDVIKVQWRSLIMKGNYICGINR